MILFVTGQYAGAQYLHPLIKSWNNSENSPYLNYKIVATGASVKYWKQQNIEYDSVKKERYSVDRYLSTYKPNLIILSASGSEKLEHLFILQAKQAGINSVSFIDIWTNYKNRFIYNGNNVFPDTILSIDDKCTKEMEEDGIPTNLILKIGQPYLEDICKAIPRPGKKILLPIQPIKEIRGNSLGYNEYDFLRMTLEALNNVEIKDEIYITGHPDGDFSYTNQPSISIGVGKGIADIKDAHTVLGMYSMQMIVAYLWGRRVASVQPGLQVTDPSPLSRWGLIPLIKDSEKLRDFMQQPFDNSKRINVIKKINGSQERLNNYILKAIDK